MVSAARRLPTWRPCALALFLVSTLALTAENAPAQTSAGIIRGRVTLSAPAPPNPIVRMGADPACSQLWAAQRPTQEFVVRGPAGELANVFVVLQGDFPASPAPSTPVVLEQRGCLFQPHLVAVRAGQVLEVRNGDPTLHNIHSVSSAHNDFNVSRPAHVAPYTVVVEHPELMLRLTCDVHSWMNVFVAVVSHPYFAVTNASGQFEIPNVPEGRYRLQIWHERYGPQTAEVNVSSRSVSEVSFTYTGTEKASSMQAISNVELPDDRSVVFVATK